jgi:hypothetical protein
LFGDNNDEWENYTGIGWGRGGEEGTDYR